METIEQLYKKIEATADFTGISVVSPNTKGLFNNYPLHVAAVWGDCEAINLLVSAGAEINQKGEHGFTPLMEAVAQGNFQAVKLLVTLGATPEKNSEGVLPSEYAETSGNEELSKWLRACGF